MLNQILCVLTAALLSRAVAYVGCYSDVGVAVDRWAALKFPSGVQYYYWDTEHPQLTQSPNDMDSNTTGALAVTVSQLWSLDLEYVVFNDEPPGQDNNGAEYTENGHIKGLLAWDVSAGYGFWLTHSV